MSQSGLCIPGMRVPGARPSRVGWWPSSGTGGFRALLLSVVSSSAFSASSNCLSIERTRSPAPLLPLLGLVHGKGKPDVITSEEWSGSVSILDVSLASGEILLLTLWLASVTQGH